MNFKRWRNVGYLSTATKQKVLIYDYLKWCFFDGLEVKKERRSRNENNLRRRPHKIPCLNPLLWPLLFFFITWFHPNFCIISNCIVHRVLTMENIVGQWRIHVTVHRIVKKKNPMLFCFISPQKENWQLLQLQMAETMVVGRSKSLVPSSKVNGLQMNSKLFST